MQRQVPPIDWTGIVSNIRMNLKGRVSAVCRSLAECNDLVKWFGAVDFCPFLPVLVVVPGTQPTLIAGFGYATAAELRDCAVVTWQTQADKLRKEGRLLDFDSLRERDGLMRSEDVDDAIRTALHERIAAHRAAPVTDPFRVPQHVRVNDKTVFSVPDPNWKEATA